MLEYWKYYSQRKKPVAKLHVLYTKHVLYDTIIHVLYDTIIQYKHVLYDTIIQYKPVLYDTIYVKCPE